MHHPHEKDGTKVTHTEHSTNTARRCALASLLALALAAILAAAAPPASAATTFCSLGSAAGRCNSPGGVAVDQSGGDAYVADSQNHRVDKFDAQGHFLLAFGFGVLNGAEELQTCTVACEPGRFGSGPGAVGRGTLAVGQGDVYLAEGDRSEGTGGHRVQKFSPSGGFELMFGGGVLDGGATGTGTLTSGSTKVTSVLTTSKTFVAGQTITGAGIPAGTRITHVDVGPNTDDLIILSNPATASGAGVALTAPTPAANNPNNEVQTVTIGGAPSGGTFSLQFSENFVSGSRIGDPVTATTSSGSAGVTSVATAEGTGTLTAGSATVASVTNSTLFHVGQTITGAGIPPGATITALAFNTGDLTLSANATASGAAVALSVTAHAAGDLTAGSNVVTNFASNVAGEQFKDQTITGAGIPVGTTITAVGAGTLTISANATASGSSVALSATQKPTLAVGEGVSGPGIPPGDTIASVAANGDFALSATATASATAVGLHVGIPFDAPAAAVQSLLEGLSDIGAGNVAVSGPAGGPWAVEFKGTRYADTNVNQMFPDGAGLTPSGTATVATTLEGASAPEICTEAEFAAGDACDAGAPGSAAGRLGADRPPAAVDSSGNVWVGDKNRLEQFSSAGEYLSELELPGAGEIAALAVDTAGDFYTLKPNIAGSNERQFINRPPSGTYTLSFGGDTTAPLPSSAGEAEIQSALEALPSIGAGNVRGNTTGTEGSSAVEFQGALADTDVEQITASGAATVETVQQGKPETPGLLSKLGPSGELIETLDASGHPNALGLDPASGDLFVSDQREPGRSNETAGTATLLEFGPSGAQLEAFGSGEVIGAPQGNALAFGATAQRLYVVSSASAAESAAQIFALPPPGPLVEAGSTVATEIHKAAATLSATVNPEHAATTYHFEYLTEAQFKADGNSFGAGTLKTTESASIGADFAYHPVSRAVSSLVPATTYRFRVVATNANGTAAGERDEAGEEVARTFTTLPPAAVDSTSASDVTADSATLEAEINPLGDATSYRFEFLTEAEYEENEEEGEPLFTGAAQAPLTDASIGSGESDVEVSQHLQGLLPHTPYRYRAFAHNHCNPAQPAEECSAAGPALTFTTQAPGAFSLPDARAWEQVSPPDKHGAQIFPIQRTNVIQAAASGDAMTYMTNAPTEADPQGYNDVVAVLSARGSGGWSSRDLALPHEGVGGIGVSGHEYMFFSSDLSLGAVRPFGPFNPALSPEATEQTPYLRTGFLNGNVDEPCLPEVMSCYTPLVTAENATSGEPFGGNGNCQPLCGPEVLGATSDLGHLVLQSKAALTEGATEDSLYEWTAGRLALISVLPNGEPAKPANKPSLGDRDAVVRHAISADGSRVVWSESGSTFHGHIYLRDSAGEEQSQVAGGQVDGSQCTEPAQACTLQLDALQGGSGAGEAEAQFQLASADGSRVFFTDGQRLTAGSGAGSGREGKADLYEYDLEKPPGQRLTDLTPETGGEPAHVQGVVLGASADGSSLYFVAQGVLGNGAAAGAEPGNCSGSFPKPGATCNLYLYREGQTTFVATLSGADFPDWGRQANGVDLADLTARVSANGRWLAFMSQQRLSGYDNRDAVSGKPDEEVYLYHAAAGGGGEGRLICASCNPTGARPHGVEYGRNGSDIALNLPLAGSDRVWNPDTWLAANIPGWTTYEVGAAIYQSRYLSDSGRLFFNSSDALAPSDTNGTEDVYTYEPPQGEGAPPNDTCTAASPTYSPASEGCVSLISSGTSAEESAFLDASETGGDVFFLTAAKLTPRDLDTSLDVYDARSGGGFPEPVKPVECFGDACQSPATAPNFATPASSSFNGPESPPARRKHPKKHHKHHKAKRHHNRAGHNHGGHR